MFVHRDAEGQPPDWRREEISAAVNSTWPKLNVPFVCLIPVRMQEAWMLLDPLAIRRAANNPNGKTPLSMPSVDRIENIPDPKQLLYDLLRNASGLSKRRLSAFRPGSQARLVTEYIGDMAVLRGLAAFRRFETDVENVISNLLTQRRQIERR
jgi:hypothetical protein